MKRKTAITTIIIASILAIGGLIICLVVSTVNVDKGISRRLPSPLPLDDSKSNLVKERNVFIIKISSQNEIFFNGEKGNLADLKARVKEFLMNSNDLDNLPEKEMVEINHLGLYPVSKGVISLQSERGASYEKYFEVQNVLTSAFNELRDELSMQRFHTPYNDLDTAYRNAIDKAIPLAVSEAAPIRPNFSFEYDHDKI